MRDAPKALIVGIEPESPADDAGFEPGCYITHIDGRPVHDIIDWRWFSAADEMTVGYIDLDGEAGEVELWREPEQSWGFEFEGALFEPVRLCRNACTFCFMRQLPQGSRDSLTLRDDDFRLSFLQGTFVTFTNVSPEDEARIIEQRISPLRFSLHAVTPEVRRRIIGKHAAHGLAVAQRLLDAGIELHAQVVLMPGENDGEELRRTLEWAYEHPGIETIGIVPLGYTKHQTAFRTSFNTEASARGVLELAKPFQQRALAERGHLWVFPSDEFLRNAYPHDLLDHVPSSTAYGDFDMFEDGIGIIRDFIDDWDATPQVQDLAARAIARTGGRVLLVCGEAQREFLDPLLAQSPLLDLLVPLYVKNDYFGGNVDVTGLLCGCDIVAALRSIPASERPLFVALPRVILNPDGVTLDDMRVEQMEHESGMPIHVVSCQSSEYLETIACLCDALSG